MSDLNSHVTNAIKGLESPLTFAGTNKQMVAQVTQLLSREGTDASVPRPFTDEMSPACRDALIRVMTSLEAAITNV